ncbi:MAG: Nicotinamide-nucleotide amidohydrolase PncC [Alphaproteobacteria bacterium MarineAlpha5_Bin12]|nr:MAG: Nicotinamide-nucleotide amidohydrolase PncC [Alphaproteobacteria bacterium MarineAlpha5_Bin12]|tara:strand:+ start:35903 stop:36364 length:462 start_codon:yes stop_codon:yes gene_type:complete
MFIKNNIKKILKKKYKIAIAESCTGGRICYELTKISGISKIFISGVIAYSNSSKIKILNVKKESLIKYGAVSKEVAIEMAKNILKITKSDYSISTTGISGPTGFSKKKPLGLVYIAISNKKITKVYKNIFKGSRINIQKKATEKSIELLVKNF